LGGCFGRDPDHRGGGGGKTWNEKGTRKRDFSILRELRKDSTHLLRGLLSFESDAGKRRGDRANPCQKRGEGRELGKKLAHRIMRERGEGLTTPIRDPQLKDSSLLDEEGGGNWVGEKKSTKKKGVGNGKERRGKDSSKESAETGWETRFNQKGFSAPYGQKDIPGSKSKVLKPKKRELQKESQKKKGEGGRVVKERGTNRRGGQVG